MRILLIGVVLSVIISSSSFADIIKKTNGHTLRGTVVGEEDGKWIVDLGYGRVRIPKNEIAGVMRETETQTSALPSQSAKPADDGTPKSYIKEGPPKDTVSGGIWDTDVRISEVPSQPERPADVDVRKKHPKEGLLMDILLWIVGYVLYANLVYLIFRIVDDEKKYSTAPAFAAISLLFFYISSYFIFSQIYFAFANIMLVHFLYSFGFARAFLFGLFFTWVVQVSQTIFFIFP